MKKKYIELPKEYLSYSQIQLWQNDPERYKEIYFDNRDELRTHNAGMEYGKVVADALEKGIDTGDLLTDTAMFLLPKYDLADKEIRAEMKTKYGWLTLMGRPDSMDSVSKSFYEYKTGKTAWTIPKVQNHLQLHFYAVLIYLAHKVVPPRVSLIWIETEQLGGTIKPTGHVRTYDAIITIKDVIETMALVTRVAREIEIAYAAHVPNPALVW